MSIYGYQASKKQCLSDQEIRAIKTCDTTLLSSAENAFAAPMLPAVHRHPCARFDRLTFISNLESYLDVDKFFID